MPAMRAIMSMGLVTALAISTSGSSAGPESPNDDDIFGGGSHQAIWGVTTDGPTVVAVGEDRSRKRDDGEVAVWTSEDGLNWTRGLPDEDVIGSRFPLSVTVGGPGLVAVGDEMAWVATPKN